MTGLAFGNWSQHIFVNPQDRADSGDLARDLPSGKLTVCSGKSPFLMGKSTISMAIVNSELLVYQRVPGEQFAIENGPFTVDLPYSKVVIFHSKLLVYQRAT